LSHLLKSKESKLNFINKGTERIMILQVKDEIDSIDEIINLLLLSRNCKAKEQSKDIIRICNIKNDDG